MKKIIILSACLLLLIACKEQSNKAEKTEEKATEYLAFGKKISDENTVSKDVMAKKFKELSEGDTLNVRFASSINEVCKAKGCWMKLDLGEEKESMVKFKDYGFFMPLDADNKEVIVNGKAFVTKISVDEQKHYAKDAGKTDEEIAKIIEPKFTYAFEADGVLMKK